MIRYLKVLESNFIFNEKSIFYAKITVSQNFFLQNSVLNII